MTAEIAIMNKGAIALAADSAVTLPHPGGDKIYNSVNKLFMLSKYHPVGIMVYGLADFSGVPWETIIKEYRKHLGKKQFPILDEYVGDFLRFLAPQSGLFSKEEQERYVVRTITNFFGWICNEIDKKVKKLFNKEKATVAQIRRLTTSEITDAWKFYHEAKKLPCFNKLTEKEVVEKQKKVVEEQKQKVFEKLHLAKESEEKLHQLAANLFLKDQFTGPVSGVVIAGYGENEHFPSLVQFFVDGFLDGQLRHLTRDTLKITDTNSATIVPFAQSEMVHTFMEGIDPDYKLFLQNFLKKLFDNLPDEIVNVLSAVAAKKRSDLTKKLKDSCSKLLEDLQNRTDMYRKTYHVRPVIDAVAILPKDELAGMAESLVNLTSFKRKMSMDSETVGGPIDVAVISKGDGFIWIKRKHYFDPKLNHGFLANYYRLESEGEGNATDKDE